MVCYLVALALGATQTICSSSASARYCDTHPRPSAIAALLLGVLCGGAIATWTLRRLKAAPSE